MAWSWRAKMFEYLVSNPERILQIATGVVTIASIITANTDTPDPATWLGKVYRVIEILAIVYGKTKQQ
jgi:hypothetical protein